MNRSLNSSVKKKNPLLPSLLSLTVLFLLSALLFSGCKNTVSYRNDVRVSTLVSAAKEALPVQSGYEHYDATEFLAFYLEGAAAKVSEFEAVYAVAPDDYTEFGILHVTERADVDAVRTAAQNYLNYFVETYRSQAENYDPSEKEKLNDATVRVYGNYVIFAIMQKETQNTLWSTVEEKLK